MLCLYGKELTWDWSEFHISEVKKNQQPESEGSNFNSLLPTEVPRTPIPYGLTTTSAALKYSGLLVSFLPAHDGARAFCHLMGFVF